MDRLTKFIQDLEKKERFVFFILLVNTLINIICYIISRNYQNDKTDDFVKYFYPFVEFYYKFERERYQNTKLVVSYNFPEFFVYGIIPLLLFIVWVKFFKIPNK